MYDPDDYENYVYPGDDYAIKGKDYWFIEHQGQKGRVTRVTGGGQETDFGGPCGPIYTDRDGNM